MGLLKLLSTCIGATLCLCASKKLEMEHTLAQNVARLDAAMLEKEKLQTSNLTLQDSVNNMK